MINNSLKRYSVAILSRLRIVVLSFLLIFRKNNQNIKFSNGTQSKVKGDMDIYKRLFESYKKQKIQENIHNKDFKASKMWSKIINSNYSELISSHKNNNFDQFVHFLDNFGHSKKYLGLTFNILIPKYLNFLRRIYIKKNMLDNSFKNWNYFTNNKDYKILQTPRFGNLDGGYINNDIFVSYTSFFNEIYSTILKDLIGEKYKPTVGEIGPGYGEQAYFLLKKINTNYIAFDLPETLTLSSFYLMNSFKNKKTLLFGETDF